MVREPGKKEWVCPRCFAHKVGSKDKPPFGWVIDPVITIKLSDKYAVCARCKEFEGRLRRNPDDDIRKLERLARQGDPDAATKLAYRQIRDRIQLVGYVPMSGAQAYNLVLDGIEIGTAFQDRDGTWLAMHGKGWHYGWPKGKNATLDQAVDLVILEDIVDPISKRPKCRSCGNQAHQLGRNSQLCPSCEDEFGEENEPPPDGCSECGNEDWPLSRGMCEWCRADDEGRPYGSCAQCGGARARDRTCACRPRSRNPRVSMKKKKKKSKSRARRSSKRNPPDGLLSINQARRWVAQAVSAYVDGSDKQYLPRLIASTQPKDRDKLKAEAEHHYRQLTRQLPKLPRVANQPRRNNPGLAIIHAGTIVNPPPRRRKNYARVESKSGRGLGHQTGGEVGEVPLEEYIQQNGHNKQLMKELEKAIKAYKRFHKAEPKSIKVFEYDDGKQGNEIKTGIVVGQAPETHYVLPKEQESNKNGSHWVHHHKKGNLPYLVMDPDTGMLMTLGGAFRTTTWLYD